MNQFFNSMMLIYIFGVLVAIAMILLVLLAKKQGST
jgi:preprotein translocase subunit SecG